MAELVSFRYLINGNTLEIIPTSTDTTQNPVQDNSLYTIRIASLRSKTDPNKTLSNLKVTVTTKMTPAYCTLNDLEFLHDMFDIPESQILYYIREASKYADYMEEGNSTASSSTEVSFPKREFVKTKVTLDCLLKAYISRAAGTSTKGTLGVISYQDTENYSNSIGDVLDRLKAALKGWGDALKGYEREGRAAPRSARKAYKETDPTTFDAIVNDLTRTRPSNV